jgi:hypothetical protein
MRPALGVIAGLAALVKTFAPPHTLAYQAADHMLTLVAPAAAASLGGSWERK